MRQKNFKKLLDGYISGKLGSKEESALEKFDHGMLHKNQSRKLPNKEAVWSQISSVFPEKKSPVRLPLIYRIAASILILIGFSIALRYSLQEKDKEVELIEYTTIRGQRMDFMLSDGSQIRLNANSFISFPENFRSSTTREITLVGEAFFKVTRNPDKPFIVHTGSVSTKVLGTAFNVKHYTDGLGSVVVKEGKVQVLKSTDQYVVLNPNEKAIIYSDSLSKTKSDFETEVSWLSEDLIFDRVSAKELLTTLEKR